MYFQFGIKNKNGVESKITLSGEEEDIEITKQFLEEEKYGMPKNMVESLKDGLLSKLKDAVKYHRQYSTGFEFRCTILPGEGETVHWG